LISFVSANNNSSSTLTDFNIGGCNFNFDNSTINVATGTCSSKVAPGEFFCDYNNYGWITRKVGLGCSLGANSYTAGSNSCCPSGMECNTTNGGFQCVSRTENCIDQTNKKSCNKIDCVWLNITNTCVDSIRDLSCGYYDTKTLCSNDIYNLGGNGIGTELCGTTAKCQNETFSIPQNGCSCQWYQLAPLGKQCQVKLVGVQMFYGATPNKFECSNIYSLGNCTNGKQNVSWTSSSLVLNGSWNSVPKDCLNAFSCNGGEKVRYCGEPIVKLPGFSLFSLLVSLGIIGLYYFFKRD